MKASGRIDRPRAEAAPVLDSRIEVFSLTFVDLRRRRVHHAAVAPRPQTC